MLGPSLTFGLLISTLSGAVSHLIFGGGFYRLVLFLLAGWIGFAFGHLSGVLFQFNALKIGELHVGAGLVTAFIFAFAVHILTSPKSSNRKTRRRNPSSR